MQDQRYVPMHANRRHFLHLSLLCGTSSLLGWKLIAADEENESWQAYESDKDDLWQDASESQVEVAASGAGGLPAQAFLPAHGGELL